MNAFDKEFLLASFFGNLDVLQSTAAHVTNDLRFGEVCMHLCHLNVENWVPIHTFLKTKYPQAKSQIFEYITNYFIEFSSRLNHLKGNHKLEYKNKYWQALLDSIEANLPR